MRDAFSLLGIVAALFFGYQAVQKYRENSARASYQVGDHSRAFMRDAEYFADLANARNDPRVRAYLAKLEKGAQFDPDELAAILRPIAKRTGKLVVLDRELRALASGQETPSSQQRPTASAGAPRPVIPDARSPRTAPSADVPTASAATEPYEPPPPRPPLPDAWWDVTAPADPLRWGKAVPAWAVPGGKHPSFEGIENGTWYKKWGNPRGAPYPVSAFTDSDPDAREFARLLLTANAQSLYAARYGQFDSPGTGSPNMREFFTQYVKEHYGESARIVLTSK